MPDVTTTESPAASTRPADSLRPEAPAHVEDVKRSFARLCC